ncbi:hypothetical protein B0H13DRAFT_2329499 [Mycena leptocephala]|nr:hypothetical protein B0H13DRAFT_2329499 [Mycena leptocephala]
MQSAATNPEHPSLVNHAPTASSPDSPANTTTEPVTLSTSLALHNCWYTVDFFAPYHGETAFVDQDDALFEPIVFGSIVSPVTCDDGNNVCIIRVALDADEGLKSIYMDQVQRLRAPITVDDIRDVALDRSPCVSPWTNSEQIPQHSGGVIRVHTNFTSVHLPCPDKDVLDVIVPKVAVDFPFKPGDWVLFQATMHKMESSSETGPRAYELRARHMRLLTFLPDYITNGSISGVDASVSAPINNEETSIKSHAPGSSEPYVLDIPEIKLTSPASGPSAAPPRPAAMAGADSSSVYPVDADTPEAAAPHEEHVAIPVTPKKRAERTDTGSERVRKKKKRRSAVMTPGGRAPRYAPQFSYRTTK